MNIIFDDHLMLKLMTLAAMTRLEFSGFGFVERSGKDLFVYSLEILDVGSEGFTEIPTEKLMALMERPDVDCMKLWIHRHPVANWSVTDETTIQTMPLGGVPEIVKWSASTVLTPHGWIGRIDNHIKKTMMKVDVLPQPKEMYDLFEQLQPQRPSTYRTVDFKAMDDDYIPEEKGLYQREPHQAHWAF